MSDVLPARNLGIINSLTDGYVNMTLKYQLIMLELPLLYQRVFNYRYNDIKVFVPHRSFSPYDQQATLHFRSALWALLLPVTIQQSVSDIFRSYVMQVKTGSPFYMFDKDRFYVLDSD
jgi:hypothetical protein